MCAWLLPQCRADGELPHGRKEDSCDACAASRCDTMGVFSFAAIVGGKEIFI